MHKTLFIGFTKEVVRKLAGGCHEAAGKYSGSYQEAPRKHATLNTTQEAIRKHPGSMQLLTLPLKLEHILYACSLLQKQEKIPRNKNSLSTTPPQAGAYISYMPSLSQIKSTRVFPSGFVRMSAS